MTIKGKIPLAALNGHLIEAASNGDAPACMRLLDAGAEVGTVDVSGKTSLCRAAEQGWVEACRVLLDYGADVEQPSAGQIPLHAAAYNNRVEVCRLLLDRGASIDSVGFNRYTPLLSAAANDATEACALLVQGGADTRARNSEGRDALQIAVRFDCVAVCRVLVSAGMRHDDAGVGEESFAYTAFQRAVSLSCLKVVRYFVLECGADLFQKSKDGRSLDDLALDGQMRDGLKSLRTEVAVLAGIGDTGESGRLVRTHKGLAL